MKKYFIFLSTEKYKFLFDLVSNDKWDEIVSIHNIGNYYEKISCKYILTFGGISRSREKLNVINDLNDKLKQKTTDIHLK